MVDEIIRATQMSQRSGDYDNADALYTAPLEALPDEPNALYFLGLLRHQQGRNDEAIDA